LQCVAVCRSVSQCVAVCRSVSQCVAVCCSVLQCVAMCCSVLQCVAECVAVSCVLQCIASSTNYLRVCRERDRPWQTTPACIYPSKSPVSPPKCHVCDMIHSHMRATSSYEWGDQFIGVWPHSFADVCPSKYGVATVSRLLKIIGLFCRISSLL